MKGLNSAVGYIRKALAKSVNLRNTPEITFVLDQSIEYGVRMSKLIDDVMAEIPSEESEDAEALEAYEDEDDFEDEEDDADEEDGIY